MTYRFSVLSRLAFLAIGLIVALDFVVPPSTRAASPGRTASEFATPEEAVAALRAAAGNADTNALREILGPASVDLMNPDRVQATNELSNFSAALATTTHLTHMATNFVIVEIGEDLWPFPVPIVRKEGGWFFDTATGQEELLNRRIGGNELAVLSVMREHPEAQREYASRDHDDDGILEFAQRLVSNPNRQDGLYWPAELDGTVSPLGPLIAFAQMEGYSPDVREEDEFQRGPYRGYYFKILSRQGSHALGGKYKYVINRNMIAGFALIAWPAEYGTSGIMTFLVNQQGHVYQKDLGPKTSTTARRMKSFDPDSSWTLSPD